ncbi:hypothetical protein C8A03DRAFT_14950 [Achaetomium macrosporum]|uniref:Uncharacterized protein n=1 Tax=Achaetomium macrosporum TaxID=79813 RepID=A0AAN7CAT4_9PEZI|nr:hypothetical protein C8A03DRAFT_14950 [Achaetomium macrosporum]
MWLRRLRSRLSIKTNKPEFREIKWNDDGEVRPVTRGKAKQFGFEELSPTMAMKDTAPYRMKSNPSCSSLAALAGNKRTLFKLEKRSEGLPRYYVSFSKGSRRM